MDLKRCGSTGSDVSIFAAKVKQFREIAGSLGTGGGNQDYKLGGSVLEQSLGAPCKTKTV